MHSTVSLMELNHLFVECIFSEFLHLCLAVLISQISKIVRGQTTKVFESNPIPEYEVMSTAWFALFCMALSGSIVTNSCSLFPPFSLSVSSCSRCHGLYSQEGCCNLIIIIKFDMVYVGFLPSCCLGAGHTVEVL